MNQITVVPSFVPSPEIAGPEALAFDANASALCVSDGFCHKLWKIDLSGKILEPIDLLVDYWNPIGKTLAHIKDLKLSPASNSGGETHLYVADFGNSHMIDSRLIQTALGGGFLVLAQ